MLGFVWYALAGALFSMLGLGPLIALSLPPNVYPHPIYPSPSPPSPSPQRPAAAAPADSDRPDATERIGILGWIRSGDEIRSAIKISRFDDCVMFDSLSWNLLELRHVVNKSTCPLMHICSVIMDMGPGPRTRAQKLRIPRGLGLCPGPIFIMAEHMCIKGNQ